MMIRNLFRADVRIMEVNVAMLIFRIAVGAMMLTHGFPKFMKILDGNWNFGDPLGIGSGLSLFLAALAEFLGSIMIIVGLGTRIGAFLLGFTMAVAGLIAHFDDPFGRKEKALLYLVVFLVIWIIGPGKYSIDNKLKFGKD